MAEKPPAEITFNPIYNVTYEGADPTRGYVYRLTATPDRSDDALAEENRRLRRGLIRATLCLSGFVGEGISVEGYEEPDDVYLATVDLLGMEDADDDDFRAALKGDGL